MRFLGVDPGYAIVGWAIIDFIDDGKIELVDYGIISTEKSSPMNERLLEIGGDLDRILDRYKPDYAGVESLLFHKNAKSAMSVSQARGVILYCIQRKGVESIDVTPLQVKSSIAGYGRASKSQVQENVKMLCGLSSTPKPDDAADAVAVAITARDIQYSRSILLKEG